MRSPNMRRRLRKSQASPHRTPSARRRMPCAALTCAGDSGRVGPGAHKKGAHTSSEHAGHCTAQVMISFSQLCMPQSSRHMHIRSAASCAAQRLWKCISAQLLLPAYLSG